MLPPLNSLSLRARALAPTAAGEDSPLPSWARELWTVDELWPEKLRLEKRLKELQKQLNDAQVEQQRCALQSRIERASFARELSKATDDNERLLRDLMSCREALLALEDAPCSPSDDEESVPPLEPNTDEEDPEPAPAPAPAMSMAQKKREKKARARERAKLNKGSGAGPLPSMHTSLEMAESPEEALAIALAAMQKHQLHFQILLAAALDPSNADEVRKKFREYMLLVSDDEIKLAMAELTKLVSPEKKEAYVREAKRNIREGKLISAETSDTVEEAREAESPGVVREVTAADSQPVTLMTDDGLKSVQINPTQLYTKMAELSVRDERLPPYTRSQILELLRSFRANKITQQYLVNEMFRAIGNLELAEELLNRALAEP